MITLVIAPHQLHADAVHDLRKRVLDDRGVRIPDDHPALALVARRRGLARFGQLRLHHQVPDPPLQLVHAVHGPHPAPALPA
jgi:AraC-like DNA-binding protein